MRRVIWRLDTNVLEDFDPKNGGNRIFRNVDIKSPYYILYIYVCLCDFIAVKNLKSRTILYSDLQLHVLPTCVAWPLSTPWAVTLTCVVTPCSVMVGYQRFRGPCCLPEGTKQGPLLTGKVTYTSFRPSQNQLFTGSFSTAPMRSSQYQPFSGPTYTPPLTLLPVRYTTSPCPYW